jgi:hypothetical protein
MMPGMENDGGNLTVARRALEKARLMFGLVEGVCDEDGPWTRTRVVALLDCGTEALDSAIDEIDRLIGTA